MPEYNLKTPRKVQKNLENDLERACKKGFVAFRCPQRKTLNGFYES